MTLAIALSDDGLPSDPRLRKLAGRTLGVAYHLHRDSKVSRDHLVKISSAKWMRDRAPDLAEAVPAVVDLLIAGGFLESGPNGCHVPRKTYPAQGDDAAARLAAVARGLGARCMPDPEGAAALTRLFLDLRALAFVFSTEAGDLEVVNGRGETAVLLPEGYAIDPDKGATMTGARLILVPADGPMRGVRIPQSGILCRFPHDGAAVVAVDVSLAEAWSGGIYPFEDMSLSPIRGRRLFASEKVALEPNWMPLRKCRKAAAAWIGKPITAHAWRRFHAAAQRSRKVTAHLGRIVWQAAGQEARTCCQRAPSATVTLYNWFSPSDPVAALRRRQASAAYPSLTHILPEVGGAIDAGEPLAAALSDRLGIPPRLVGHLRGRKWQELGKAHKRLLVLMGTASLSDIVSEVAPERLPSGKAQWLGFVDTVGILTGCLSWPAARPLVRSASADWSKLPRLSYASGLSDAVRTTSWDISLACEAGVRDLTGGACRRIDEAAREALVTWVLGDDGGLARIERFAAEWHRGATARTIERMRIEREIWGDAPISWVALTARPYETPHGTLAWITHAEALVEEGRAMSHCVGSHQFGCLYGESHVAQVTGARGGRSTVEVSWACTRGPNGRMAHRLALLEHKAYGNAEPPEDCVAAVKAFLEGGARRVDRKRVAAGLKARATHLAGRRVPMPPWGREALMRSYDPCLGRYGQGLTASDWEGRILASINEPDRAAAEPWDDNGSAPVPRQRPAPAADDDGLPF